MKEHRRSGDSDYRSGSKCYRVNRGSRRALIAANWAGCCIAKIGKGNIKKKETSEKEESEGRDNRDERRKQLVGECHEWQQVCAGQDEADFESCPFFLARRGDRMRLCIRTIIIIMK